MKSELDFSACSLKVGIEVHQQLAASTKLFCPCPITKSEELPLSFQRRLRPSQSELGQLDPAAIFEFNKGRVMVYRWNPESSCLVDADEEPPHPVNMNALETSILISLMLRAMVVDEIHVMRKIVIDGSNTTGFQRTAVVGLGGALDYGETKRVGVQSITVEEDSARALGETPRAREYALDRLGVPLVEIALDPIPDSPEDVEDAALQLGRSLRSTQRVSRGLGTIRQDLNVSVMGGEVVEVKGVQKLNLIAKVVRYEATRQMALVRIAEQLKERSVSVICKIDDVTPLLPEPASQVLARALKGDGARLYCVSAEGLAGLIGYEPFSGVRVGKELGEIARTNGLGGVIHSDEFAKQGVTKPEERLIREHLGLKEDAALVLIAGEDGRASTVAGLVKERLEFLPRGVLRETRAATEDGETRYLRPRPGAARMYPETDIPDIVVTRESVERLEGSTPVPWEQKVAGYSSDYSISRELALQLYDSDKAGLFEELASRLKLDRSVIASIVLEAPVRLSREGLDETRVTDQVLESVVLGIDSGLFAKEAAYEVLRAIAKGDAGSVEEAVKNLGITPLTASEVDALVDEVIAKNRPLVIERGERAFSVLMGEVMKTARGRVDGERVSTLIRAKMKRVKRDESVG